MIERWIVQLAASLYAGSFPREYQALEPDDQSQDLGTDTYVEKRQGVLCTAQLLGNSARIVYPGNSIKGPVHLAGAFQFIAEAEGRFQIADIPGLADDGKTKLAARLVRGGAASHSRLSNSAARSIANRPAGRRLPALAFGGSGVGSQ